MDASTDESFTKIRIQFKQDTSLVFQHLHRIIRCIIDCKLCTGDSISVRNALELARCLSARAWENSPSMLRQLKGFGPVMAKKFVNSNITSLDMLRTLDAQQIERIAGKNPTWGSKVLQDLNGVPWFRLHAHSTNVG